MSSKPGLSEQIDSVIVGLRRVQAGIGGEASKAQDEGSEGSFELVSGEVDSSSEFVKVPLVGREATAWSPEWEQAILAADTPSALLELDLGPILGLERGCRLRQSGVWSPLGRLALAFRSGVSAARVLRGEDLEVVAKPELSLRNSIHLCLRSDSHPKGFWTGTLCIFRDITVKPRSQGELKRGVVAASFPSKVEATAYLVGARLPWPQHLK